MLRIGSAAALLVLVFGTIWVLPAWVTAALAAVVAMLAGAELAGMSRQVGVPVPAAWVAAAAGLLSLAFLAYALPVAGGPAAFGSVLLSLIVGAGAIALTLGPPGPSTWAAAAVLVMAPLYVGLPLGATAWIQWALGPASITWLLVIVAVSDSAQYYTGRAFGRSKLAPRVSPAKTREGAVGGVVAAAAAGALLAPFWLPVVPMAGAATMAAGLALVGIVGDLFESLLKRSVGVKDSSHLIPGHGGVLDRIDSHLFAAPIFYLAIRYVFGLAVGPMGGP